MKYLDQYIKSINPFTTIDDVEEFRWLNEWDFYIAFKNGEKFIFDSATGYHKKVFYNDVNEITEEQEKKEFTYRLRNLMVRRNIDQGQLANEIGSTQAMISRYVRGETIPSVLTVRKIAKVLNCSMDDFFYKDF